MPRSAPFGFGYWRCPDAQLTIEVFARFLRNV
jgi:hypothetical protein